MRCSSLSSVNCVKKSAMRRHGGPKAEEKPGMHILLFDPFGADHGF